MVLRIGSQLRGRLIYLPYRDWREACWGRDPEKFCAHLFLTWLSLHSKVILCTAEGSQGALAPQTLCSPEFKTESPHLFTHHSPSHLGSRPPKWLAWGFASAGPGEVSFKVALWMGQDFVIGSRKRGQGGGNGGEQETVREQQANIFEGREILGQALPFRNSP